MGEPRWFMLGFTSDDVVVASQDSRLALECGRLWEASGRPAGFRILQAAGEGEHLIHWFVDEATAEVLDRENVGWRRFLLGERAAVPPDARDVLPATVRLGSGN